MKRLTLDADPRGWRRTPTTVACAALLALAAPTAARGDSPTELSSVETRVLAAQPGDTILFILGNQITEVRVNREALLGRTVRLRRSGAKMRGRLASEDVEMSLGPSQVTGQIAGRPIALDVARAEGRLTVAGRFGARAVSLRFSLRAVDGEIGPCRYDLAFRRDQYIGRLACGGEPTAVQLRVPTTLVARGDVELAAMLTAFLAR